MRYLVYGAGAVGSVTGAYLHLAGIDVLLVARPGHAARINEKGLIVRSPSEQHRVSLRAVTSASGLAPFQSDDVVLLTVKSQHTQVALTELRKAGMPSSTPLCCMQNAVVNERLAASVSQNVYGILVAMPALFLVDGEVAGADRDHPGTLEVGRYPEGVDETTHKVALDLEKAGFLVMTNPRIMRSKNTKLLLNLANVVVGIVGLDCDLEERTAFIEEVGKEARRVWESAGIDFEPEQELNQRVVDQVMKHSVLPEDLHYGGSTWQSLVKRSGSVETEYLNGEVVEVARKIGIAAPLNERLCRVAEEMAKRGLEPGSHSISDLRRRG